MSLSLMATSCAAADPHGTMATGDSQASSLDITQEGAGPMARDTQAQQEEADAEGVHREPTSVTCNDNATCREALGPPAACMQAECDLSEGRCTWRPGRDYVPCDDGDPCTIEDACIAGSCAAGSQKICDDGNPCTQDSCETTSGCVFFAADLPCDDGNGCTEPDSCDAAACAGAPTDGCSCMIDEDCEQYEDEDLCNGRLTCQDGICAVDPFTVVICDTLLDTACAKNMCFPSTGLCEQAIFNNNACSDGNPCTQGDHCEDGVCTGASVVCECVEDLDCAPYNDEDQCNGALYCDEGTCRIDPASIVKCPSTDQNPCTHAICHGGTGTCLELPIGDGVVCDDSNPCTTLDACREGTCSGLPAPCDDGNPCTVDTCDSESGCVFSNQSGDCNDNDPCTIDDVCLDGVCQGSLADCDDGDSCTTDTCIGADACAHEPIDCDDDDPCTADVCAASTCMHSQITPCILCEEDLECYDEDICTIATCGTASGICEYNPVECDDDNPCTDELCTKETGCTSANNANACNDDDPCTESDSCAESVCAGTPVPNCGANADCCEVGTWSGCENEDVVSCVCALDPYCCEEWWHDGCVDLATAHCELTCAFCGDEQCDDNESCAFCPDDCGPCAGDCCADNGDAGCENDVVSNCVCDLDDFCCLTSWDDLCVNEAILSCDLECPIVCGDEICLVEEDCETCPADCAPCDFCGDGTCSDDETCMSCPVDCGDCGGDCCAIQEEPGCNDTSLTSCVCEMDPSCCLEVWDKLCVEQALLECEAACPDVCDDDICSPTESCGSCADDCGPCNVCGDGVCAEEENCGSCTEDCLECSTLCSAPHLSGGCDDQDCAACVCAEDDFCCDVSWDDNCVLAAISSDCLEACADN